MKKRIARYIAFLLIQAITSENKEVHIKKLKKFLIQKENPHVSLKALASTEIVKLAKAISDHHLPALQGLFLNLGLQTYNIRQAEKGNLKKKLKAFEALSKLRIVTAIPVLTQYVLEKNKALRAEAIMSLMRLSYDPLFFLENPKITISVWEAMKIHGLLKELPKEKIPQFTRWLDHKQKSVVLFSLRMILHYQQKADLHQLSRLVKSKSARIADEAQKALILRKILVYSDPDEEDNQLNEPNYEFSKVA
ncbi:hypothetical protein [Ekhidna sp.]|uniref:hypothetical protein n=1 Tax=Ekhidna sp. TaxID=2608089 RepID=UPI0032F07CE1